MAILEIKWRMKNRNIRHIETLFGWDHVYDLLASYIGIIEYSTYRKQNSNLIVKKYITNFHKLDVFIPNIYEGSAIYSRQIRYPMRICTVIVQDSKR